MTLLIASALLAAAVGFLVVHPILTRRFAVLQDVTAGHILDAEARKRVALNELKELEYEFLGGKLDEADYEGLRVKLSSEAIAAIRASDAASASPGDVAVDSGVAPAAIGSREAETLTQAHSCGFANPHGSRFCAGCGANLV